MSLWSSHHLDLKKERCFAVCGSGRFGRTCKESCEDSSCRAVVFCLQDPYGCSCATGWRGLTCSEGERPPRSIYAPAMRRRLGADLAACFQPVLTGFTAPAANCGVPAGTTAPAIASAAASVLDDTGLAARTRVKSTVCLRKQLWFFDCYAN